MSFLFLGFLTGLSLILAIGAQNIFVIEQGLKKQYVFLVCLICSLSDTLLIFAGIILFNYFVSYFSETIILILNFFLLIFLFHFVWRKYNENISNIKLINHNSNQSFKNIFIKTLGFTYLNPHVYSDTVFFLGNFSKNFHINEKIYFGIGASASSFIFFYTIGYMAKFFSKYLQSTKIWKIINRFIIFFILIIIVIVSKEVLDLLFSKSL